MTRYLRNPLTGKFVGSIGSGKTNIPTLASRPPYNRTNPYIKPVFVEPTPAERKAALTALPESLEETIQVWTYKRPWVTAEQGSCNRAYTATTPEELAKELQYLSGEIQTIAPAMIGAYWNPKVLDGTIDPIAVLSTTDQSGKGWWTRSDSYKVRHFRQALDKLPFGEKALNLLAEDLANHPALAARKTWIPETVQKAIASKGDSYATQMLARRSDISDETKILLSVGSIDRNTGLPHPNKTMEALANQVRLPEEAIKNLLATKNESIYWQLASSSKWLPDYAWDAILSEGSNNQVIAKNKSAPERIRVSAALTGIKNSS